MSSLVQFEPIVDSTIEMFLEQLESRFEGKLGPDGIYDLGTWLQYYTFDVIGELPFSKRLEPTPNIDNPTRLQTSSIYHDHCV
jgi:hypothetical protein